MHVRYTRPVLQAAAASKLGGFKSLSRRRQWHHSLRDGGSARKIQYLVVGAVTGGASLLCWQAYNGSSVYKLDANEPYSGIRGASRSSIVEQAPKNGSSTSTSARDSREADMTGPADDDEVDTTRKGAYNPDTGEFNWDCTCLGGMSHGTCGEEFMAAFSCFMLSTGDPEGVDYVGKFRSMQNCFQDHPDEYDSELSKGRDDDMSVVKEEPGQAEKKFNC